MPQKSRRGYPVGTIFLRRPVARCGNKNIFRLLGLKKERVMTSSERETAANIRGDIQRGRSGDKKPGFDPAAAPMETDGEAGGTPLDEESVRLDRAAQYNPDPSDHHGTDATAMRMFEPERAAREKRQRQTWILAAAIAFALVVLAVIIVAA
jgi:hypothetical protein